VEPAAQPAISLREKAGFLLPSAKKKLGAWIEAGETLEGQTLHRRFLRTAAIATVSLAVVAAFFAYPLWPPGVRLAKGKDPSRSPNLSHPGLTPRSFAHSLME
jgi:hypothetical protein